MRRVRVKTTDNTLQDLIRYAASSGLDLMWDRYERMVPQCGFSMAGLCCSCCTQGPCRVNPFSESEERTICGRDREGLVAAAFSNLVASGAAAHLAYAHSEHADGGSLPVTGWIAPDRTLCDPHMAVIRAQTAATEGKAPPVELFKAAIDAAVSSFMAGAAAVQDRDRQLGAPVIAPVRTGIWAMSPGTVNILYAGSLPSGQLSTLQKAFSGQAAVYGCAGSEMSRSYVIPPVAGYAMQELPLATGLVDAIVLGDMCAAPALAAVAQKEDVPVFLSGVSDPGVVLKSAENHYRRNQGRVLGRRADAPEAVIGFYPGSFDRISDEAWQSATARSTTKGVVIISGCGNVKEAVDGPSVRAARSAIERGYAVLATGCAALAIAKAGLMAPGSGGCDCSPTSLGGLVALAAGVAGPAVMHFGSCWETARALEFARMLQKRHEAQGKEFSVTVEMPELSRAAAWSSALAVAALGIETRVGPVFMLDGTKSALDALEEALCSSGGRKLVGPGSLAE